MNAKHSISGKRWPEVYENKVNGCAIKPSDQTCLLSLFRTKTRNEKFLRIFDQNHGLTPQETSNLVARQH